MILRSEGIHIWCDPEPGSNDNPYIIATITGPNAIEQLKMQASQIAAAWERQKMKSWPMKLTARELATALASLRNWQESLKDDPTLVTAFEEHFNGLHPLRLDEIDALCEYLNQ